MAKQKANATAEIETTEATVSSANVVARIADFTDTMLRGITSFEDAYALAAAAWGEVSDAGDNIGNGFTVMPNEQKNRLVGVSFVIVNCRFVDGDFGEYVSLLLVTQNNENLIMNDGSTGVYYQVRQLVEETGRMGGWAVKHGLRVSEYDTCFGCGKPRPQQRACDCGNEDTRRAKGETFYFDAA